MNLKLKRQISIYAGIAGSILLSEESNAQVIHTDVNPDIAFNLFLNHNSPYNIDLDNNGVTDFQIQNWALFTYIYIPSSYGAEISFATGIGLVPAGAAGLNQNQVNGTGSSFANPLPNNQLISQNLSGWFNDSAAIVFSGHDFHNSSTSGGWTFNSDFYAGVHFQINNQWHYGWIRITAIDGQTIVVRDYAYEATPDTPISSRDFTVGLTEQHLSGTLLRQDGNNFSLSFNNSNFKNISVKNLLGQDIISASSSESNFDFSIDDKGIFIVEVIANGSRYTKKIFIY